jgi:hypothetical protein
MKTVLIIVSIVVGLALLAWLGLMIQPKPFSSFPGENGEISYVPLPKDLPEPVERFYLEIYGDQVPQFDSVVISGRARMRVNGLTFPGRFRFTHVTGEDYRHYIEATIFGLPLMKVNERYLDGVSRMELPFGITEGEPKINQAANLALWAEAMWFPAILVTDPDVRWEPRDQNSAILVIPFEEGEEQFVVHFDPQTGLLKSMQSNRYKEADSQQKTIWLNQALEWKEVAGYNIPFKGAVTWADEGTPWAVFSVEDLVMNYDVSEYIRAFGP